MFDGYFRNSLSMTLTTHKRNNLAQAASPYLQQHRDNPVHWQEWNDATLEHAMETGKPILLSVGYAACHWCHVMAHESFENQQTADLMNEHFINIKVDREERPDVDQIYMAALHAMGEQGGWPLTMFLTPDALPFWGGTYFPPTPSHGRPSFNQVLVSLAQAFEEKREAVSKNTEALKKHLENLKPSDVSRETPDQNLLKDFVNRTLSISDETLGGIKGAPKFPNAPILETWARASNGDPNTHAGKAFLNTLERISNGGIYDHLAGGIARYSVDQYWLVPHFEKMLYDNAHFLRHLTLAYKMTSGKLFAQRIHETVAWLENEMKLPDGTFAASLDADSEGVEGKFYVWDAKDVEAALGPSSNDFLKEYSITSSGNWEDQNILNRLHLPIGSFESESKFEEERQLLLSKRETRIRPDRDDKVLTDWNAYAIRALCEAGNTLKQPDWINMASTAFHSITESNSRNQSITHSRLGARPGPSATAVDYGALINASLTLFETTADRHFIEASQQYLKELELNFSDQTGGYYLTSTSVEDLIIRPTCDHDEANPSGASQILEGLIRHANLSGDVTFFEKAEALISNQQSATRKSPYCMAGFMNALHAWFNHRHVAIFGEKKEVESFRSVALNTPHMSTGVSVNMPSEHLELTAPEQENKAFAVVCQGQTCSLPYHSPEELHQALQGT